MSGTPDSESSGPASQDEVDEIQTAPLKRARSFKDTAPPDPLCWLCAGVGPLQRTWRGHPLHDYCWNAVRSHKRMLRSEDEKEADLELLIHDQEVWKVPVVGLVVLPGAARSIQARRTAAHQLVSRTETFTEDLDISDQLLLTRRRFGGYMRHWEQYGDDSASESFARRLSGSESEHRNSDDEVRVRVKDNDRLRRATGRREVRTRSRCRDRRGGDRRDGGGEPGRGGTASGGGGRARSRGRERCSGGTRRKSESTATTLLAGDSPKQKRSGASAGGRKPPAPTAQGGSRADGQTRRTGREAQPAQERGMPKKDNPALIFMKKKDDLLLNVAESIRTSIGMPSAVYNTIAKQLARMSEIDKNDLSKQFDAIAFKRTVDDKVAVLKGLKSKLEECARADIDEIDKDIAAAIADLNTAVARGVEGMDSIRYILDKDTKAKRCTLMQKRYARSKMASAMVSGGYGKAWATAFAQNFQKWHDEEKQSAFTDPGTIDLDQPIVWTQASDMGKRLAPAIAAYQEKCAINIKDKKKSLLDTILARKWGRLNDQGRQWWW